MSNTSQFASRRRQWVKKNGKRLLHALADFQGRQSLIGDKPVFDKSIFPWITEFEENWKSIRSELEQVLKTREKLPSFHDLSPDQYRISKGDNWKTFAFYAFGDRFDPNCNRCPETARLLDRVPHIQNAMFSILSPGYHIPPHQGPTKGIIRIHLGLIIPDQSDQCWIRVDDQICHWEEGKCIVFDDFFEHEVWNKTDQQRVVLFFDVDRPMHLPGKLVSKALIAGMKRSAYVQDARKNMQRWDGKYSEFERSESGDNSR